MEGKSRVQVWATAISTNTASGRKIIFRYAKDLNPDFDQSSQSDRIIVSWRYRSETGQPASTDYERMVELESALEAFVEAGGFATLALVSTGENLREWMYYARSKDEFLSGYKVAIAGIAAFPVELQIASDPTWSTYREFIAGVV